MLHRRTIMSRSLGRERSYWISLPEGYRDRSDWPLLLGLHGLGERGDDPERVLIHGVGRELARGRDLPFVVLLPQCPKTEVAPDEPPSMWPLVASDLLDLVDHTVAEEHIDPDRVLLTGISMGGFGCWYLASHSPGRWAAVAPICGWGDPAWVEDIGSTPLWAFHGEQDETVPASESRTLVEALRRTHPEARLTLYPDLGHDCWTRVYAGEEIYSWFLSHRRPTVARPCRT